MRVKIIANLEEAVVIFRVLHSQKRIVLRLVPIKIIIYSNSMKTNRNELIRRLLSGITNDELQNLVRVREEAGRSIPAMRGGEARRPIPTPKGRITVPAPEKMDVKQLIRFFENNPIPSYRPIPAPRTKKRQPVATPWTKIGEKQRALKGFTDIEKK